MIGKVYLSTVDFYDIRSNTTRQKTRPVLVVGGPSENDYTVLPISTVTNRNNLNPYYDLPISPQDRVILHLKRDCFIRTHKQMPVHVGALFKEIGDMKRDLPDLYLDAVGKMELFQKALTNHAI